MHDFEQLDPYQLLGVSPKAAAEDIKRAYRQEIAQYHPDKWSNASPSEQEYARKRAAAITEAYSQVRKGVRPAPAAVEPAPTPDRAERLAQLYDRGRTLLAEGKHAEAAVVLRQLQQADPFYRDSADLLHRAEAGPRRAAAPAAKRRLPKGALIGAGSVVGVAALAGAIWVLAGSKTSDANSTPTTPAVAVVQTEQPEATADEGVVLPTTAPPTAAPPATDTAEPPTAAPPATDTAEPPTAAP
ncbi:MAG TPA: J domain-containing protein, partial [Herpetosiphonaceae bacterium]|nr:J domain-containing protein [Herpetosiphonaceae bacterium]